MTTQSNAELLKRLTATFLVEANEHVEALGSGLIELEKLREPEPQVPLVERLYREAHSLKGAARVVNAHETERLCQELEGVLGELKAGKRVLSVSLLDELHRSVAVLGQQVAQKAEGGLRNGEEGATENAGRRATPGIESGRREADEPAEMLTPEARASDSVSGAAEAGDGTSARMPASCPAPPSASRPPQSPIRNPQSAIRNPLSALAAPTPAAPDTVRIAMPKLDAIFVQAEELLAVKLAQTERVAELRALADLLREQDRQWAEMQPLIRDVCQRLGTGAHPGGALTNHVDRLLACLEREREQEGVLGTRIAELARLAAEDKRRLDTCLDRLMDDVKKALMLPFSTALAGFPKMVRDLARDTGKDVTLEMYGTDIEIDKRILERVKDPLLHIVRNCVDHGIESPAERAGTGKPPRATVTLCITQAGGKVEITATDDGRGVDATAVRQAAVRAGVMTAGEVAVLPDRDAIQLVFRSGVSTSRQVTEVSGRGLGMAIVADNVVALGGTVSVDSEVGGGTSVRMVLPLTLATLRGTVVVAAGREFVVPTVSVVRVLRVTPDTVRRVENRDSIHVDGCTLALVWLAEVLGLKQSDGAGDRDAAIPVLVLEQNQRRIAFAVDRVVGEQEVLAKPLGRLLRRVRNLAGATIVGAGRVVPILSVPDLLQAAVGCTRVTAPETTADAAAGTRLKRLLVADDSITARTLLQNILESAGYAVRTVPDGAVAYSALRDETFDLVVTDVEMPRMDGFELTKRIRGEPGLAELPVVLVTAREAPEDRARGLDAGANAYIVKSSFEQSNLLEVIGKLV